MIDLRSSSDTLHRYVERYCHLLPPPSARLPIERSDWIASRACTLTEGQALDRAKGCLLGLAIGDVVGTTLEFLPRDRSHVHDMVGGGPFNLKAGEWTDDTSLALCLAETCLTRPT